MEEARRANKPARPVERHQTQTALCPQVLSEQTSFLEMSRSVGRGIQKSAAWMKQEGTFHTSRCVISASRLKGLTGKTTTDAAFKCCQECEQTQNKNSNCDVQRDSIATPLLLYGCSYGFQIQTEKAPATKCSAHQIQATAWLLVSLS